MRCGFAFEEVVFFDEFVVAEVAARPQTPIERLPLRAGAPAFSRARGRHGLVSRWRATWPDLERMFNIVGSRPPVRWANQQSGGAGKSSNARMIKTKHNGPANPVQRAPEDKHPHRIVHQMPSQPAPGLRDRTYQSYACSSHDSGALQDGADLASGVHAPRACGPVLSKSG